LQSTDHDGRPALHTTLSLGKRDTLADVSKTTT
jgi:hypothetical protein